MIGAFVVAEIAFTFGQTQRHSNFQTVPMDGSDSFSMENWPQCTQAVVQKMEMTTQVCKITKILLTISNLYEHSPLKGKTRTSDALSSEGK